VLIGRKGHMKRLLILVSLKNEVDTRTLFIQRDFKIKAIKNMRLRMETELFHFLNIWKFRIKPFEKNASS
jgi:hypothetical protein